MTDRKATCAYPGCKRERIPTVNGLVRANCADHELALLRRAFEDRQRAS